MVPAHSLTRDWLQVGEAKALIGQALSLLSVAAPDSLVLSLVTDSVVTSHQQRNILQADAKPEPDAVSSYH